MSQHDITPMRERCIVTDTWKLKHDAIERVERVENNTTKAAQFKGPYTERQTPYMILLKGEKRLRRVFATPIGNVSSMYFKVYHNTVPLGVIFCELALDEALNRPED
jgi:hypothetical protein